MNRRITFSRDSYSVLKSYIMAAVSKSVSLLRGNDEERVKLLAQNITSDTSLISQTVFQNGDYVDADSVNDLFDRIYTDYAILYKDMYGITDAITTINSIFENSIFANVVHSVSSIAKIRLLESLNNYAFVASNVFYDGFSSPTNYSTSKLKCAVDNSFGSLTLGYSEKNYITPATSNVSVEVLSGGVRKIDENDNASMFSSVPGNPYFINLVTSTDPINIEYDTVDYSNDPSALIDIIITFPSAIPLNHISFVPFSTDLITVKSVFYSTKPNAVFGTSDLRVIKIEDMNQDNLGFSLSFDRINAREMHIVVAQNAYQTLTAQTAIDKHLSTIDKIASIAKRIGSFGKKGFTHSVVNDAAIDEIRKAIISTTVEESEVLQAGVRVYTLGFFRLSVADRTYLDYGEYMSTPCTCDGNLSKVSITHAGSEDQFSMSSKEEAIVNAITLSGIEVLGKRAYCSSETEYGTVLDGFVVQQNRVYSDGLLSQSSTYPYCVDTHFPVHNIEEDRYLSLSVNGKILDYEPADIIVEDNVTISRIIFRKEWCIANGIYEGIVLCGNYTPRTILSNGFIYDTQVIDIEKMIGKPTVINQKIYAISDPHLYVKDPIRSTVDIPFYVEYSKAIPSGLADPGYMTTVINDEDRYRLNQNKGLPFNTYIIIHAVAGSTITSADSTIASVTATKVTAVSTGTVLINVTGGSTGTCTVKVVVVDGYPLITEVTATGNISMEYAPLLYSAAGWYPSISSCVIPTDAFYTGIMGEPIHYVSTMKDDITTRMFKTATAYVRGSLRVIQNGFLVDITEYMEDTDTVQTLPVDKQEFYYTGTSLLNGALVYYIPIDHSYVSEYYSTNINAQNATDRFTSTAEDASLILSSTSYLDKTIVLSESFALQDGIFYYRNRYNVTYEPFIVTVNGIKAKNISQYRGDPATPPTFSTKTDKTSYEYYVRDLRTLVFDSSIKKANIVVRYYNFADKYQVVTNMFKSNYRADYLTPEVTGLTAIMNIQR